MGKRLGTGARERGGIQVDILTHYWGLKLVPSRFITFEPAQVELSVQETGKGSSRHASQAKRTFKYSTIAPSHTSDKSPK